jgi:BirA family biotin operon repressor/biotin-[acetyl-CoA-carboxylase] ligase
LRSSLRPPWIVLDVVEIAESTNSDLLGAAAGSVLVAEYQHSGRGRMDRSWNSPPRAGLMFSAVVEPDGVRRARWGWLPMLTGMATCVAVEAVTGVPVELKWPNDVLSKTGDKLAGILVQAVGASAVIGVGLNVSTTAAELTVPTATSLALAGAGPVDRTELLAAILAELGSAYLRWLTAAGADQELAAHYRERCATVGRAVQVITATGTQAAYATGIDADDGRLLVRLTEAGPLGENGRQRAIAAADIVHLRTTGDAVG